MPYSLRWSASTPINYGSLSSVHHKVGNPAYSGKKRYLSIKPGRNSPPHHVHKAYYQTNGGEGPPALPSHPGQNVHCKFHVKVHMHAKNTILWIYYISHFLSMVGALLPVIWTHDIEAMVVEFFDLMQSQDGCCIFPWHYFIDWENNCHLKKFTGQQAYWHKGCTLPCLNDDCFSEKKWTVSMYNMYTLMVSPICIETSLAASMKTSNPKSLQPMWYWISSLLLPSAPSGH